MLIDIASCAALALTSCCGQDPAPVALPTVLHLGPLPADLPQRMVPASGELPPWPTGQPELGLRAAASTPAGRIVEQLTAAIAAGTGVVHLVAALPGGREGAILLALPEAPDAPSVLTLRAHHERNGVPAASVTPLLRRLLSSWSAVHTVPFVLELQLPANATYGQLLPLVAACAEAGAISLVLRASPADLGVAAPRTAFALDLQSALTLQVEPRDLAAATGVATDPIGSRQRAPAGQIPISIGGGAGGRYGGRGGGGRGGATPINDALQRSQRWLGDELAVADSGGDRTEAIEATALTALCMLATGSHLGAGERTEPLRRAIGVLVAAQHDDGGFGISGPGSTVAHALATYALIEAYGLSPPLHMGLLKSPAQRAVDRLFELQGKDRGWHHGDSTAASDACSTAWAMSAIATAQFFGLHTAASTAELVSWFDEHPQQEPRSAAAALFAYFFSERDLKQIPSAKLVERISEGAEASDPETCYWATFALFQNGGRPWMQWLERLDAAVVKTQDQGGAAGSWTPPPGQSRRRATALWALSLSAYRRYGRMVR